MGAVLSPYYLLTIKVMMKHSVLKFVGALAMLVAVTACKKDTSQKDKCPEGAVDLGIVMTREDGTTYKVYWATCNLCKDGFVSSPEVYGDYYAWGETKPKSDYSWSTYKFGTSESGPFSKYNTKESYGTVDNDTELDPGPEGDDVVSKLLGGKWRMPTDAEWTELRTKCTWDHTLDYNGTGVRGMIVTSNVEGYKDKSIFLPAVGQRDDTDLCNIGTGYYWSSSLKTEDPSRAWHVRFYLTNVVNTSEDRHIGLSVRPVYVD